MSETLPISIDPDAVNQYIAKQIIKSTLGERLEETVSEALKAFDRFGNDPLKGAVISEINKEVMNLVRTEFASQIQAAIRERMTPEFIDTLVSGFMHSVTARLDR
jgi:hypothetical protein